MKESLKGGLLVIAAMSIFALMGVFVRFIDLPVFVIVFYDFIFAAILMSLFFFFKDRSKLVVKGYFWWIFLLGVVNLFNNFFFFQAFKLTTISNAVLSHYTMPVFVALLAPFFLKERLERVTIISLIIAATGLILITYNDLSFQSKDFLGIALGTASGLMFAFVILIIKFLSANVSVYTLNIYQSYIMGLLFAPLVLFTGNLYINANQFMLLLGMALLFGILATILHMSGVKRIKSQHSGILAYTEPFAATLFGFLFFSEIPMINTVFGGLLIILSGYLIIRREAE